MQSLAFVDLQAPQKSNFLSWRVGRFGAKKKKLHSAQHQGKWPCHGDKLATRRRSSCWTSLWRVVWQLVVHQLEKFKRRVGMPNATAIPLRKLEPGRPSLRLERFARNLCGCLCGWLYVLGGSWQKCNGAKSTERVRVGLSSVTVCWKGRRGGVQAYLGD